tara:strand:- start:711 stop:869 length:159 start_codon:yes stop_codon:yes gene_type:complete
MVSKSMFNKKSGELVMDQTLKIIWYLLALAVLAFIIWQTRGLISSIFNSIFG